MLTSRLPFEGDSPVSIAIQHFSAVPLNPREINPEIPPALEKICLKAMAPQISNRYATADEMVRDLEEFRKIRRSTLSMISRTCGGTRSWMSPPSLSCQGDSQDGDAGPLQGPAQAVGAALEEGRFVLAAIAASVMVIWGLYKVILNSFSGNPTTEYEVPDLLGMTVAEAGKGSAGGGDL